MKTYKMSIQHYPIKDFTTPELLELREQDRLLEEKYRIKFIITEEDLKNHPGRLENLKVGDTGTQNPPTPDTKEGCVDLFLNYYTQSKLIDLKMHFLAFHLNKKNNWNVIDIETRLSRIRDFIKFSLSKDGKGDQLKNELKAAYLRIRGDSYKNFHFNPDDRNLVNAYSEYVLFYDFLRAKLIEIYRNGEFIKLNSQGQMDLVLSIIKDHTDMGGISFIDLVRHLEDSRYVVGFTLIKEILNKIEGDKKISMQDDGYILTFEGRMFKGYREEKIALDDKTLEDKMYRQRSEAAANRLNYLTAFLGIATCALGTSEMIKIYSKEHEYFCLYVGTLGIATLIILLTIWLRKSNNDA